MKIVDIHKEITQEQLFSLLEQKLNSLFQQQTQSDINFEVKSTAAGVAIEKPALYEGALFVIAIKGTALQITRSEHYTDDVNSLTLESVLNALFEELAGENGVSLSLEG